MNGTLRCRVVHGRRGECHADAAGGEPVFNAQPSMDTSLELPELVSIRGVAVMDTLATLSR